MADTPDSLAAIVAELRELEAKAIRPPWRVEGEPWQRCGLLDGRDFEIADGPYERRDDLKYVAALVNHAPALLTAAEESEKLRAELDDALIRIGTLEEKLRIAESWASHD